MQSLQISIKIQPNMVLKNNSNITNTVFAVTYDASKNNTIFPKMDICRLMKM